MSESRDVRVCVWVNGRNWGVRVCLLAFPEVLGFMGVCPPQLSEAPESSAWALGYLKLRTVGVFAERIRDAVELRPWRGCSGEV